MVHVNHVSDFSFKYIVTIIIIKYSLPQDDMTLIFGEYRTILGINVTWFLKLK
jgi:hypothetical protein